MPGSMHARAERRALPWAPKLPPPLGEQGTLPAAAAAPAEDTPRPF